jgi:hypothetical protein
MQFSVNVRSIQKKRLSFTGSLCKINSNRLLSAAATAVVL